MVLYVFGFLISVWVSLVPAMMHTKACTLEYPGGVLRFPVPREYVDWKIPFAEYNPVDYTSDKILEQPSYADPEIRLVLCSLVFI